MLAAFLVLCFAVVIAVLASGSGDADGRNILDTKSASSEKLKLSETSSTPRMKAADESFNKPNRGPSHPPTPNREPTMNPNRINRFKPREY